MRTARFLNNLPHVHSLNESWSYGSWIYNYLCSQCISSLTLWVRIQLMRGVLNTTLCDKVYQWLVTDKWFSPGIPVSSTNKADRQDIAGLLLTNLYVLVLYTPDIINHYRLIKCKLFSSWYIWTILHLPIPDFDSKIINKSVNFMQYSTKITYIFLILCIKFKCCNNL